MRIRVSLKYLAFIMLHVSAMESAATLLPSDNLSGDTITPVATYLDETVVTAVKTEETLTSSTPTFTLDQSRILRRGITDISDAIHRLPGVTLRDYGGAGGLKTVSVRGLGSAHTAVIYDGLPLTDIQNGAIDLSRYSTDRVETLQLIIGDNNDIFIPARVGAAAATLSITTPGLYDNHGTSLTARLKGGSFGYVSPSIEFSQKFSDGFFLGASGEFLHTDNNYPFRLINGNSSTTEKRHNNRMNSGNAQVSAKGYFSNGASLSGKVYYYDNSRQLPGPVIYYNVGDSKESLRENNFFAQAEFLKPWASKWKLRVGGKFNRAVTLYTDRGVIRDDEFKTENYFQREYYATANLLFTPLEKWQFDYSADYSYNNLNSNLDNDARPHRNALLQSVAAKFSSPRFTAVARLIESLYFEGAKSPLVERKTYSKLSPAVSLNARLLSEGLLYARLSYKNIFRMPTFNEAYFNHFGSPDLRPESTHQINFGLSYQLSSLPSLPLMSVTADVYVNRVKDRIVAVPYNMFVWTVTNLNSVHAKGADITLNSSINLGRRRQLLLAGTWSYQRSKINVAKSEQLYGKQVAYTPLNSGSFSLSYENPWLNAVVHGQGVSARYAQNSNIPQSRLPGYFEFGLTFWRNIPLKNQSLEIRLDILNILDKQYVVIARYPMPGRSFMASVKWEMCSRSKKEKVINIRY